VQISYLDTDSHGDQNVRLTEKVQLPFFKEAGYNVGLRIKDDDAFLEIVSENDVTTKAIIFDNSLLLADSICPVFYVFETGYANYSEKCAYCVSFPKDSVLNYLKDARYPCYLEFAKGETIKKVRLDDLFQ
jgi:hypothetical protein